MNKDYLEINNLPNNLTMFRIILVPIIIICLSLQLDNNWLTWTKQYHRFLGLTAAIIFAIASITDFIDGYVARKKNMVTMFGSFLDPIADKFLVVSSLIILQAMNRIMVPVVIILVLREIYMTSLRLLATAEGLNVPVNSLGKWKTATQMIGIPMVMANIHIMNIPVSTLWIGRVFIWISAILSIYSCIQYSVGTVKKLKLEIKNKRKTVKEENDSVDKESPTESLTPNNNQETEAKTETNSPSEKSENENN